MLSSEWLHFCLFQDDSDTTSNEVLSVSIQTYSHAFFQQKKHTIRATIGPSQSPWGEGKFVIVYTDHVEKGKRALGLPKAILVKEPMIKGQFYKNTVWSVFDCLCMHRGISILTVTQRHKWLRWKENVMSLSENRSLSFSQSNLYLWHCVFLLVKLVSALFPSTVQSQFLPKSHF